MVVVSDKKQPSVSVYKQTDNYVVIDSLASMGE